MADTILKKLLVKIGFSTDETPLVKLNESLEGIKSRIDLIASSMLVSKLYEMSESFAKWGLELKMSAETMGMSVEKLQELQFAAEKSGVSAEQMGHSLSVLARHIYTAKTTGGEAAKVFSKIGITPDQVASFRSADQALYVVADKIAAMPDAMARMGAAQQLLGRGSAQMVAFLAHGSAAIRKDQQEMRELGLVLSGPQVEALEKVQHSFSRLHSVIRAFSANLAAEFGPVFARIVDLFIGWYKANKDLIASNVDDWLMSLSGIMGTIYGAIVLIKNKFVEWTDYLGISREHLFKYIMNFITLVFWIKVLSTAFVALRSVVLLFGSMVGTVFAPWLIILGSIFLIVVNIHNIWAAFTGGKKWFPQIEGAIEEMLHLKNTMDDVHNKSKKMTLEDWALKYVTEHPPTEAPSGPAPNIFANMFQGGSFLQGILAPETVAGGPSFSTNKGGDVSSVFNPTIINNFAPGADQATIAKTVSAAIDDKMKELNRKVDRGVNSGFPGVH